MYPQTDQQSQTFFHLLNTGLPYSLTEMRRLESSLLNWLQTMHILKPAQQTPTLLDIEKDLRNGTLLCSLAEMLTGNEGPICGFFSEPRGDAAALSNLRKAFEVFRRLPRLGRRFLWSEKEIHNGDRGAMFGLLEDLHKFSDGNSGSPARYPYYGRYAGAHYPRIHSEDTSGIPGPPFRNEMSPIAASRSPDPGDSTAAGQSPLAEFCSVPPKNLETEAEAPRPYPCPVSPMAGQTHGKANSGNAGPRSSGSLIPTIFQTPIRSPGKGLSSIAEAGQSGPFHDSHPAGERRLFEWLKRLRLALPGSLDINFAGCFKDGY